MRCPACLVTVKRRGLRSHIRGSKNSKCQQYLEEHGKKLGQSHSRQNATSADGAHNRQGPEKPENKQLEATNFDIAGDLFGNYCAYLNGDDDGGMIIDNDLDEPMQAEKAGSVSTDSENDDEEQVQCQCDMEPERTRPADTDTITEDPAEDEDEAPSGVYTASCTLHNPPVIIPFSGKAGKVYSLDKPAGIRAYQIKVGELGGIYQPFSSRTEWEVAKWAKARSLSSTAFTDLMSIEGVTERLNLSFKSSTELNKIIDAKLPNTHPRFVRHRVLVGTEMCDVYFRDIVQCIEALVNDSKLSLNMVFAPEKHYTDESRTTRMYHDMHTGEWWWTTQKMIEKDVSGASIIPVIVSTDKTQLTLFRNKSAYPVYITIGNIPKEIRRKPSACAYVLLGYLPTTKLVNVPNNASRRRMISNLYHSCMGEILRPLQNLGKRGIFMATADGRLRRMHPIMAAFIGDYPEQILTTCSYSGDCPCCHIQHSNLGDGCIKSGEIRNLDHTLDILSSFDNNPTEFVQLCKESRIKPVVTPFWKPLPYLDIYRSITPDVLHQLYQGLIKHLVNWLIKAFGPLEIDARCCRIPANHNIRIFTKGISSLSHISGKEHDQISRILIGLIVGLQLGDGRSTVQLVRSACGLLDFLFLAQYPIHTDRTLILLQNALDRFHDNKGVFIELGIRKDFNLPKLHFANHYVQKIKFFGMADNFNTEYTERLHIDLAKDAYCATNRKDEYAQMTIWQERKEKILQHERFIQWRLNPAQATSHPSSQHEWITPGLSIDWKIHVSQRPSTRRVSLNDLITKHGATYFHEALSRFIILVSDPSLLPAQLERAIWAVGMPKQNFWVWHRVKFVSTDPFTQSPSTSDAIHANPNAHRFDTALIRTNNERNGLHSFRIGRIRAVFSMPPSIRQLIFREGTVVEHLVYVEWFTQFPQNPDPNHLMYKVSVERDRSAPARGGIGSIVPLSDVVRSIHLFPIFGPFAPVEWTSENVLDHCNAFYVNPFTDRHLYRLFG